jgi:tRNA threonylcarbamoyladenosine biosynthesis protein TsaB
MPSLTQLLTDHRRLLVLDATSTSTQVGLLSSDAPARWLRVAEEAGTAIFTGTEALLQPAGCRLADVGAFVFCAGPGSMLGTRTVAMALRTWQALGARPIYSYISMAVAARHEWARQAGRSFTVIADARRDTWHCQPVTADGALGPLQRLPAASLPDGEWVTPENFRAWAPLPRPAAVCSYDLAAIFPTLGSGDFFTEAAEPDAFQHEAPEYKKWSAQIHSSATAPAKA